MEVTEQSEGDGEQLAPPRGPPGGLTGVMARITVEYRAGTENCAETNFIELDKLRCEWTTQRIFIILWTENTYIDLN